MKVDPSVESFFNRKQQSLIDKRKHIYSAVPEHYTKGLGDYCENLIKDVISAHFPSFNVKQGFIFKEVKNEIRFSPQCDILLYEKRNDKDAFITYHRNDFIIVENFSSIIPRVIIEVKSEGHKFEDIVNHYSKYYKQLNKRPTNYMMLIFQCPKDVEKYKKGLFEEFNKLKEADSDIDDIPSKKLLFILSDNKGERRDNELYRFLASIGSALNCHNWIKRIKYLNSEKTF